MVYVCILHNTNIKDLQNLIHSYQSYTFYKCIFIQYSVFTWIICTHIYVLDTFLKQNVFRCWLPKYCDIHILFCDIHHFIIVLLHLCLMCSFFFFLTICTSSRYWIIIHYWCGILCFCTKYVCNLTHRDAKYLYYFSDF